MSENKGYTEADDLAARQEGWAIFICDDGINRIQRLDDPGSCPDLDYTEPKFDSDDEAIAFVEQKALTGSVLHLYAVLCHNTKEVP